MSAQPDAPAVAKPGTWLSRMGTLENNEFWESVGKRQAWTTLILTTAALTMAFITWFSGVGAGGPAAADRLSVHRQPVVLAGGDAGACWWYAAG